MEYHLSTSENSSNCLIGVKHERVTDCVLLVHVQDSVSKVITYIIRLEEQLKDFGSERTSRVQSPWRQESFFNNLVIMYWTLNRIYVQFENTNVPSTAMSL